VPLQAKLDRKLSVEIPRVSDDKREDAGARRWPQEGRIDRLHHGSIGLVFQDRGSVVERIRWQANSRLLLTVASVMLIPVE
jgi:hypothetical protein